MPRVVRRRESTERFRGRFPGASPLSPLPRRGCVRGRIGPQTHARLMLTERLSLLITHDGLMWIPPQWLISIHTLRMDTIDHKAETGHFEVDERGQAEGHDYAPDEIQKNVQSLEDPEVARAYKSYMRKLDLIILPTITLLYFFEYLDRGNVANAKLYGLATGHDTATGGVGPGKTTLTPSQWNQVIMFFYIGLILFQVPGCLGYRVFPPSKWIAFGVCFWAVASLLQDTAYNFAGLVTCRVFLGVGEGLFGTGILYYLSLWYKRGEMGVRVFWFLGPTALAGWVLFHDAAP